MTDFCLHKSTIGQFTKQLFELISTGKRYRIKISEWRDLRTIPMNATWRMWVATTGDWLRARGVVVDIRSRNGTVVLSRPISNEEVHDYYVGHWLGRDENGEREETSKMDKGRMLHLMELHEQWCLDKGVPIIIPNNCEFMEIRQKQVA